MIEFEDHTEENQKALLEYLEHEELASSHQTCPYCGAVNLFPWVPRMMAYTCRKCRQVVEGYSFVPATIQPKIFSNSSHMPLPFFLARYMALVALELPGRTSVRQLGI
jgi:ribosomal protein L37AE/L43A